jgi:hypothetical protein
VYSRVAYRSIESLSTLLKVVFVYCNELSLTAVRYLLFLSLGDSAFGGLNIITIRRSRGLATAALTVFSPGLAGFTANLKLLAVNVVYVAAAVLTFKYATPAICGECV